MGKENKCEYFAPGPNQCGFAKWLKEKSYSDKTIPASGCGKKIKSCYRVSPEGLEILNEYGPYTREEFDIALPPKYASSKGRKKRLP